MLRLIEQGLEEIGYTHPLLRRNYAFADLLGTAHSIRHVPLAAFAQEPLSYRSACLGVVHGGTDGNIEEYRALGAPQLLELSEHEIRRWKVTASGAAELLQRISPDDLLGTIREHQADWGPERILRAKSIAFDAVPAQLDFFDIGLLAAIEAVVHTKLDALLRETLAASKSVYQERNLGTLDYPGLFRLIFRLLAAKLFADRGDTGDWMQDDPAAVVSAIEQFYFRSGAVERVVGDPEVQRVAWGRIRSAFHLQNISVEALAYVYENTLVDPEMRRRYGTHSTPREVAEYLIRHLPFEDLALDDRRVFEPFAGHAAFLIAALGRLRALLPTDTEPMERHKYFVRMLGGLEIDSFAREVARLSLMLADYPNPDGWRLLEGDVFSSPLLDTELSRARVVLCNPPFEDFTVDERSRYSGRRSVNKAADILLRTLEQPPELLGFVLPRSFIDGQYYRDARRKLAESYRDLEIVGLPDSAFQHSDMETALLIAHHKGGPLSRLHCVEVGKKDYDRFVRTGESSREESATVTGLDDVASRASAALWLHPLQRVWRALDGLPVLSDVSEIHNGIYYGTSLREDSEHLVSKRPRNGFRPGLGNVEDGFEPLLIRDHVYLNMDPAVMYERSRSYLLPWDRPKVIVNKGRLSRGPWGVAGTPDHTGLVVFQLFHGVWPTRDLSVEVLSAIVSGPLANAFMSAHRTSRDNRIGSLKRVPIPHFGPESIAAIDSAVGEYRSARLEWLAQTAPSAALELRCRDAMLRIDAEVLSAYDLPPRLERELLDYFAGHRRPGPVTFDQYYPADFRPALPLRMFISGERERASANLTLQRLPVIRDPAISEAVAELE